jgi:hypothetical protein
VSPSDNRNFAAFGFNFGQQRCPVRLDSTAAMTLNHAESVAAATAVPAILVSWPALAVMLPVPFAHRR